MSFHFASGGGGCGLCSTETQQVTNLTPEELRIVQPILLSFAPTSELTTTTKNKYCDWPGVNCSQIFFCSDCQFLLKKLKRLQVLYNLVSSDLETIVEKVKVKYFETRVWVKSEEIASDENL